jgi:hypothetical protein
MCSCNDRRFDFLPFRPSLSLTVRRYRGQLLAGAGCVLALVTVIGVLVYLLMPGDIERAESDIQKAKDIVLALDQEADSRHATAKAYRTYSSDYRTSAERGAASGSVWVERNHAIADSHSQLSRANGERRDTLIHLTAVYVRLVTEAETELLRAKDARDRGIPYKVAPRVREILSPILSTR